MSFKLHKAACLAGSGWTLPAELRNALGATLGVVPNPISLARLGTGHLPSVSSKPKQAPRPRGRRETPKKNIQHGMLEQATMKSTV